MTDKIRIYQLAKDLDIDYKIIIKEATELGIAVKSYQSSITAEDAELISESFKEQTSKTAKKTEVQPEAKTTPEPVVKPVKEIKKEKPAEKPVIEKVEKAPEKPKAVKKETEDVITVERKNLQTRPPVVTVMGHVDHGKTQLLDTIRNTNVVAKESGGITQHIGASKVAIKDKGTIVFIDTPGHEAFTSMRARGTKITDIVVLVVSGDDGVMPQTIEALNHAKAAGVPIIIAINKKDLPEFDSEKVRTQLSQHDILTEDWGGDIIAVEVSAKTGDGINDLLEMIILQSEMMELKAAVDGPAEGIIIESELDKRIGPTATLIVTEGTLHSGDSFICGIVPGKIKAMNDENGNRLKSAVPATPVKILGFEDLPQTGDIFQVVKDKTIARDIANKRKLSIEQEEAQATEKFTLEDLQKQFAGMESKELKIVLKTDVTGTLEAIKDALNKMSNETDEVNINIIHAGVGTVTKHDIMLAAASGAIIMGFSISAPGSIKKEAEEEGVQIRTYRIIYDIIEDIKKALEGMLEPEEIENVLGQAEVKQIFTISGIGTITGCSVINGMIRRKAKVRVLRDSKIIYEGDLGSLKRFKNDVSEVKQGYECGIGVENFNDLKIGDIIESYQIDHKKRTLASK
jgi:translation initiation factor IF-2